MIPAPSATIPSSARSSSFFRDFAGTAAAQALSLGLNALTLAVISRRLGTFDLGLFTLQRRGMALTQPLLLLGLTVATPRYIALHVRAGGESGRQYAGAGVFMVVALSVPLCALIALFPEAAAEATFGDREAVGMAKALAGFAFVMALYQALYGVLRGYLLIWRANVLEVAVVGALPLVLALVGSRDIVVLTWTINVAIAAVTIVMAASVAGHLVPHTLRGIGRRARQLLRYGAARTPGDLAVVGLMVVAPLAVVHYAGPVDAGYTSIVQSTLSLVGVAAIPLGVLLLPRFARTGAKEIDREERKKLLTLTAATLDVSLASCALLVVASPLIIRLWLPSPPEEVVRGQQLAALGLPGYLFYLIFRSFLDAVHTRPLSSFAALAGLGATGSLVVLLVGSHTGSAVESASIAVAAGLMVAGVTTFALAARSLPGLVRQRPSKGVMAWFVAVVAAGLVLTGASLAIVALATVLAGAGLALVISLDRPEWIEVILARVSSADGTDLR